MLGSELQALKVVSGSQTLGKLYKIQYQVKKELQRSALHIPLSSGTAQVRIDALLATTIANLIIAK